MSGSVNPNGSLSNCTIVSETPAGAGFGRAAQAACRSARLSPRSVDGVAVGGQVRFNVTFNLPD
jgi:protein TonB